MSNKVREIHRRTVEKADPPDFEPGKCPAYGCPMRASVGDGTRFYCSAHFGAGADRWQSITSELRSHDWLLGLIGDLRAEKLDRIWRKYATDFWAEAEPGMVPDKGETRELYLYRLHLELLFRVGARGTKPEIMVPQGAGLPKWRGNIAELIGGELEHA